MTYVDKDLHYTKWLHREKSMTMSNQHEDEATAKAYVTIESVARAMADKERALHEANKPAVFVEPTGETSVNYEFLNLKTQQSIDIIREVLPDMLNRFLQKNADYGDEFINLGPRAEFVRIANKFGKLKQALWDGEELQFEQVEEILDDFLGHVLLTRLRLREEG